MKKKVTMWVLHNNGTFIASFRFKPKRVRQGRGDSSYWAWVDCNGPKYADKRKHPYAANAIEGSMNAKCKKVEVALDI